MEHLQTQALLPAPLQLQKTAHLRRSTLATYRTLIRHSVLEPSTSRIPRSPSKRFCTTFTPRRSLHRYRLFARRKSSAASYNSHDHTRLMGFWKPWWNACTQRWTTETRQPSSTPPQWQPAVAKASASSIQPSQPRKTNKTYARPSTVHHLPPTSTR